MIEALPPPSGALGNVPVSRAPGRCRAWLGTVPSGCSFLQDTRRIPGGEGGRGRSGYAAAAGISIGGDKQRWKNVDVFHLLVFGWEEKMAHHVLIIHTCGHNAQPDYYKSVITAPFVFI